MLRDLATIVAASPVPISKTFFDFISSTFSSASFTAIEPNDIPPLLIPVEFLIRVPIRIDVSNNLFNLLPEAFVFLATAIDSLICPRICSSPTTNDSNPDVSFSRCSNAS